MSGYLFTETVRQDANDIWDYISQDIIDAVDRVIAEFQRVVSRLSVLPDMGHRREDLTGKDYRFWSVHSYLIIYNPDSTPLQIVRILSGFRDITPLID
ncbi:MAG TPA: type II toxin-antitoxin system RelE/ParE family toxin [Verrucomicrobiales bacterium]|nr:type II toxin-antitoxin system RelE/ParE family toxin [Verrucomicrobiales bacterium]